jgi:hypothetical protein
MRGKTERIDGLIKKVLLKKGITKNIQSNKIRSIISSVLSEDELARVRVGQIKNRKLFLHVDSSSMLYEIKCFKKDLMLEKINGTGDHNLSDISVVLDNNSNG